MSDVASANLTVTFEFSLSAENEFGSTVFGPSSTQFSWSDLDITVWDTVYAAVFWIPAKVTVTATTVSGSPTLSTISALTYLAVGQLVTGTGIPGGTVVTAVGASTVTISKNATASNVGTSLVFQTVPTTVVAALAEGGALTNAQAYFYRITATGPQGAVASGGASSSVETMASAEVTATITGTTKSVTLTWDQVDGATGYKIYRGTTTLTQNLLIYTVDAGDTLEWTDDGSETGSGASVPSSPPNNYVEFDFSSFDNAIGVADTMAHALGFKLAVTGDDAYTTFVSGTSNGMEWPFVAAGDGLNWGGAGAFAFALAAKETAAEGQTVDSSNKTYRITNSGSGPQYSTFQLQGAGE